ncbi:hypothetical protein AAC387_Pa11g1169 [Persea americana]
MLEIQRTTYLFPSFFTNHTAAASPRPCHFCSGLETWSVLGLFFTFKRRMGYYSRAGLSCEYYEFLFGFFIIL